MFLQQPITGQHWSVEIIASTMLWAVWNLRAVHRVKLFLFSFLSWCFKALILQEILQKRKPYVSIWSTRITSFLWVLLQLLVVCLAFEKAHSPVAAASYPVQHCPQTGSDTAWIEMTRKTKQMYPPKKKNNNNKIISDHVSWRLRASRVCSAFPIACWASVRWCGADAVITACQSLRLLKQRDDQSEKADLQTGNTCSARHVHFSRYCRNTACKETYQHNFVHCSCWWEWGSTCLWLGCKTLQRTDCRTRHLHRSHTAAR